MRILLVGDYPNDARLGSSKVLLSLRNEFNELGHDAVVLFSDAIGAAPRGRRARELVSPILAERAVAKAFRDGDFDVVDIASGEGAVFGITRHIGSKSRAVFVSRSNGIEHLNHQRALDDHHAGIGRKSLAGRIWHPATRLAQVAFAATTADALIVLNARDREFAVQRKWLSPEKISVVPHGVSDRFLKHPPDSSLPRGRGLLFCGTWTATKGVKYLADAFTRIVRTGHRIPLTILGGGWPADYIRNDFPEDVRDLIEILPRANENDVAEAYSTHDLLIFPSSYEGFGLVLIEAMSQCLPVISTPVGAALDFVEDGVTGISVPSRNSEALAAAVIDAMNRPEFRRTLAENALARVSRQSWRETARHTLDVYESAREDRLRTR